MRSIRNDINFEALQREIDEAEDYLVRRSFNSSMGTGAVSAGGDRGGDDDANAGAPSDVRASREGGLRRSFDDARHEAILGTVGRKPLSRPSSATRTSYGSTSPTTTTSTTTTTAMTTSTPSTPSRSNAMTMPSRSPKPNSRAVSPAPSSRDRQTLHRGGSTPTNPKARAYKSPSKSRSAAYNSGSHMDSTREGASDAGRSSRYVDAAERERLLNRLLGDAFKSQPSRSDRYAHSSGGEAAELGWEAEESRDASSLRGRSASNASDGVSNGDASASSHNSLYFASDLAPPSNAPAGGRISRGRDGAVHVDESSPIESDSLDGRLDAGDKKPTTSASRPTVSAASTGTYGIPPSQQARRSRSKSAPAVRREPRATTTSGAISGTNRPAETVPGASDRSSSKYRHIPVFTDDSPLNQRGRFGASAGTETGTHREVYHGNAAPDALANATTDTSARRQYLKTTAELREEAEKEFRSKYPFAPHLVSDTKWLPVTKTTDSGSKQEHLMQKIEGFRIAHEAKQRKREQEKRELEAMELQECTFKPQLSKGSESIVRRQQVRSRSLSPPASSSTADQHISLRSALSRSSIHSHIDATRASADDSVVSHKSLPPGSGAMAAAERLHMDAHQRQIDMATRAHFLRRAQDQEVTFKPQINESTDKILRNSDYKPLFDRLGDEQRSRSANREKLLLQHEREMRTIITNKPSIAPKSRSIVAAAEQRRQSVSVVSDGGDNKESPTAAPSSSNSGGGISGDDGGINASPINASASHGASASNPDGSASSGGEGARTMSSNVSIASAASSASPNDVSQRLFAYTKEMQARRAELVKKREEEQARQMQRAVPVSRGSELIAARSEESGLGFLDRQALFEAQYKRQAALRKAKEDALDAELFHPVRERTSDLILRETRPEVLLEGPEERARRMSLDDKKMIEMRKQELEKRVYDPKVYSFSPRIDKVSRILGREPSIKELHENRRGQRIRMEAQRRAEDRELRECSFTPKLTPYVSKTASPDGLVSEDDLLIAPKPNCPIDGRSVCSATTSASTSTRPVSRSGIQLNLREPERMSRDIKLYLKEKEEKRRQAFIAKEIEELNECTFKPSIPAGNPVIFQQPVVVRGIARHLELKALSDRLKRAKIEREEKAFKVRNIDKFQRTGAGTTVVKEFHLSEPTNKMSRSVADMLNREFSNMTFEPNTVDGIRRGYAREVMSTFE